MGEKFRLLVDQELADHRPPPLGQMIETAMADGRRIKRRRAVRNGLAGAALAGVVLVATAFVVPMVHGTAPPVSERSGASVPAAAGTDPSTLSDPSEAVPSDPVASRSLPARESTVATTPPAPPGDAVGGTADATPAAVLQLLTQLLPGGPTSNYAGQSSGGMITVQTYLNRGQGPGMLHLVLAPGSSPDPSTCEIGNRDGVNTTQCRSFPNGDTLELYEITNNCVQRYGALYVRKDGLAIHLNTASCLDWDGTRRPAGQRALSADEATAIVSDPAWAMKLPRTLVDQGARRFPDLPRVVG
jgi:hypothetical protein